MCANWYDVLNFYKNVDKGDKKNVKLCNNVMSYTYFMNGSSTTNSSVTNESECN